MVEAIILPEASKIAMRAWLLLMMSEPRWVTGILSALTELMLVGVLSPDSVSCMDSSVG